MHATLLYLPGESLLTHSAWFKTGKNRRSQKPGLTSLRTAYPRKAKLFQWREWGLRRSWMEAAQCWEQAGRNDGVWMSNKETENQFQGAQRTLHCRKISHPSQAWTGKERVLTIKGRHMSKARYCVFQLDFISRAVQPLDHSFTLLKKRNGNSLMHPSICL